MGMRFAIAGAAVIALIGIFAAHNSNVRREAIQKERASVEQQAKKKDAQAQSARRAAAADDPIRLLEKRGELRD